MRQPGAVAWLNVNGIHDIARIEAIAAGFGLHPMTLEDILNTYQRPKCEEFDEYLFVALKMLDFDEVGQRVETEHVSIVLGADCVISFLEDEGDVFDGIRERIRLGSGRLRQMGADFLAYCLMDTIVDHYFLAVERIGDRVEVFDERMLSDPREDDIHAIHRFKQQVLALRKAAWPLREVTGQLHNSDSPLLHEETRVYWRDLHDHTLQVIDMVETTRDILASLHDTYLSSLSNRMNEVMKVLTIMASLFIPITFLAGVYGMNFEHIPETHWRWAYPVFWVICVVMVVGLLVFFRRRGWIGRS
jgi:magnesium transporter